MALQVRYLEKILMKVICRAFMSLLSEIDVQGRTIESNKEIHPLHRTKRKQCSVEIYNRNY